MLKRMVLGFVCVMLPSAVCAQGLQDSYLPSKSQLYLRWDGMQMHQAAYDKTAVGKMMKGDTGKFLDELWKYVQDQVQVVAQNQPKVGPLLKDVGKLVGTMHQNGIVLGVAADKIVPPEVQAVIVFPKAAGESGTVIPLIQKIAEETKADVKATKVGKRFVNHVEIDMLRLGWWAQGDDAVIFIGTTDPVAFAKDIDAKKTGVASHPLYQKVVGFNEFKTHTRGYFDLASVLTVVSDIAPPASKIVDELGLKGMKNITFMTGFDGPGERSVVDVDMPGPRTGLLSLTSQKKISLKNLPVLPNDLSSFTASSINLNKSYDVITKLIDGIARVVAPDQADNIKDAIKAFQGAIGVDLDKELFSNLGEVMVTYSSPSDGLLGTGAVVAIEVKDGKKLSGALTKLIKAIPQTPGGEIVLKNTAYRSGEILQLQMTSPQANMHLASFGIYKNWFLYSQYPQPIKGFILRQEGELPAWKANDSLNKALTQFPSEFNAIRVSDPRPTVQALLAATPLVMNILNSVGQGVAPFFPGLRQFDLELIPHAQDATRHLFPNVTVGIDDGKRIRTESRGSLLFPF